MDLVEDTGKEVAWVLGFGGVLHPGLMLAEVEEDCQGAAIF